MNANLRMFFREKKERERLVGVERECELIECLTFQTLANMRKKSLQNTLQYPLYVL